MSPMSARDATLVIEALPAAYGDCVLVSCAVKGGTWRLLVDTGTDECWPDLKQRLGQIPAHLGKRHIDLAVISHIDHDHIGAAHALFDDRSLGLTFGDVWFNAPQQRNARGVAEGRSLANLLGTRRIDLPWNQAWGGQHAVTGSQQPFVELATRRGAPRITLLSPNPTTLAALFKVWARTLQKLGQPEKPVPRRPATRGTLDLEHLALAATPLDRAAANGSSIAFLLEHRGRSVLLAADAHAPVLVNALRALAKQRAVRLPWQLDVFKLSHHGSSANVTADLFDTVQAKHYLISTNGAIFDHPDDEAIARVIVKGGTKRKLHFNYRTARTEKWSASELRERYGYSVVLPVTAKHGAVVVAGASSASTSPTHAKGG